VLNETLDSGNSFKYWRVVSITDSGLVLGNIYGILRYSLLICSAIMLFSILIFGLLSNKLTQGLRRLVYNMDKIKDGKFDVFINLKENDEIGEISRSFKNMIDRIDNLINEVYLYDIHLKDLEIKKKEAELNALQSQINPHFLFNTMESIRMNLIRKGDMEISDVIQDFALLLRRSIETGSDSLPLRKELDLMEYYLKIQKFRYRDKFEYKIDVSAELYEVIIPKFIIQPIVENALYHGIEMKDEQCVLKVFSRVTPENIIIICVEDDGAGMNADKLNDVIKGLDTDPGDDEAADRIGIRNVHQRLKLYYGPQYGVQIESTENIGTSVKILLPRQTGAR